MPEGQRQHVQIHRKIDLRKRLLTRAAAGAVYLPYAGDGDIAAELYTDRPIVGNDVDPERIATAQPRLPDARLVLASADEFTDFGDLTFAVADFDAYSYPYQAFRLFWQYARKAPRLALYFTDGQKNTMFLSNKFRSPDDFDTFVEIPTGTGTDSAKRKAMNFYWLDTIQPWLKRAVAPWVVDEFDFYNRGQMLYWGAVVSAPAGYDPDRPPPLEGEVINAPSDEELLARIADPALRDAIASRFTRPTKEAPGVNRHNITDEELGYDPMKSSAFGVAKKRHFLHLVAEGSTLTAAARACGITPKTVYNHFDRMPAFKEAYEWAQEEVIGTVENALVRAAQSGNVTAIQVYLYNRAPDRWADRRSRDTRLIWDDEGFKFIADIFARIADPNTIRLFRAELARLANAEPPTGA